jgi:hypothetical protein
MVVDVLVDAGLLRAGGGDDEVRRGTASSMVVVAESIASRAAQRFGWRAVASAER